MQDLFELNYSKINSYLFCPYLYSFLYIEKKYSPNNAYSSLGKSIHRALKRYAQEKTDLESLFIAYEESWENSGYQSPKQMMEFYNKGRMMLENFWLLEQESNSKIIYSEKDFKFNLEDFIIKGTIDRLDKKNDNTYELLDYKTSTELVKEEDLNNNLQLNIYALGLKEYLNIKISSIGIYNLSFSKKVTISFDEKKYKETYDFLFKIGQEIKNFNPIRKGNCEKCMIKKICSFSTVRG